MQNPLKLTEQQKRFLTLDGQPVHANRAQSIFYSTKWQAAGIALAFNAASYPSNDVTNLILRTGLDVGILVIINKLIQHLNNSALKDAFRNKHENLAIDTQPGSSVPPTSPDNLRGSSYLMRRVAIVGGLLVATDFLTRHTIFDGKEICITHAFVYSDLVAQYLRFRNVMKKDWVITDLPKPQNKTQEIDVLNKTPQVSPS